MKCYNPECLNEFDYEKNGSAYCSDSCKSKCVVMQEAKRPVKYKFSDGSLLKKLAEMKEEAAKRHALDVQSTLDVLTAPLI